jgi:hypothetical protein
MDEVAQKEAQEIEAAAQRKKTKGKSVAPNDETEESGEELDDDDYENSVRFL